MVKVKRTPPKFLQRKLEDDKFSIVKNNLPHFLKETKEANDGVLPANVELLYSFVAYLGKYHKSFKNLGPEYLSTGWKGVYQIYDMIRKNAHQSDEKLATELPNAKGGKVSPTKSGRGKKENECQAKPGKKAKSIAQITANRNVYLEQDEKDVKKYKTPHSESSLSASPPLSEKSKTIKKDEASS